MRAEQLFETSQMHLSAPPPPSPKAAVRTKAAALLLLVCCLVCLHWLWGFCVCLFCALLSVRTSFAIILKRMRELVALLLLSYGCRVTVHVL